MIGYVDLEVELSEELQLELQPPCDSADDRPADWIFHGYCPNCHSFTLLLCDGCRQTIEGWVTVCHFCNGLNDPSVSCALVSWAWEPINKKPE